MKAAFILATAILFFACTEKKPVDRMSDDQLQAFARELAHKYIITDGHVDLPYRLQMKNFRLERKYMGIPVSTTEGDFDFERAKVGGLDVPFMSVYIPSSYQLQPDNGKAYADSLITLIETIARELPDKFALAKTPAEAEANFKAGKISLPMGMENGAPIGNDIANVTYFYNRGIRYITLTHGKDNQLCDSSYDTTATWNGLSPFGEQVVKEMNRVGIMVDISHVSDSTFYDVLKLTQVPVIASHSSCRAFTPGFLRNMSDEMIKALGRQGGVIQINFGSAFLDSAVRAGNEANRKKLKALLDEKNLKETDSLAKPVIAAFQKENPSLFADVKMVADHIDHVVKLAGIAHVGIGSDFDGVGDSLPTGLKDVAHYPTLIYELLKRGYTEEDIAKVCYKNVWRVWNQVIAAAQQ
ncbi:MAG: dipeptidase [Cyclobacteriaceae bacterium]|nr:dipeptidase [Cyclobacteriaceae bacterium]